MSGTKRCAVCRVIKPLSDFYRSFGSPDGLRRDCKVCARASVKASNDRLRSEIGDEEYRRRRRDDMRQRRAVTGTEESTLVSTRARNEAIRKLIEAHRDEFDGLYRAARLTAGP